MIYSRRLGKNIGFAIANRVTNPLHQMSFLTCENELETIPEKIFSAVIPM